MLWIGSELPAYPLYLTRIQDAHGRDVLQHTDYYLPGEENAGKVKAITDAAGRTTQFQYDAGRRTQTTIGPAEDRTVQTYDERGNVVETFDALSRRTVRRFDDANQLEAQIDPLNPS